jgi:hypothetical protein
MTYSLPVDLDGKQGEFWIPGSLSTTGRMTVADDYLQVELDGVLQPPRSFRLKPINSGISTEISGNPKDIVSDFIPTSIFGRLADGMTVTLLDARADDDVDTFDRQAFRATQALIGAHALPNDTPFQAVRVSVPAARYWPGLFAANEVELLSMQNFSGKLMANFIEGIGWLEMSSTDSKGLAIHELDRRYWNRFFTLLRLWTDIEPEGEKRVQLQTTPGQSLSDFRPTHRGLIFSLTRACWTPKVSAYTLPRRRCRCSTNWHQYRT